MSTVPRRAGGTTFFRHVHLEAGIEVPRAPLVAYGKERCARAAPRKERGPGAPLAAGVASAARSWPCSLRGHVFADEDDLRRRGHGTTSRRVPASKTRISSSRFFGPEPVCPATATQRARVRGCHFCSPSSRRPELAAHITQKPAPGPSRCTGPCAALEPLAAGRAMGGARRRAPTRRGRRSSMPIRRSRSAPKRSRR